MLIVVGFFTLLTLVLALWNPVSDCGCFGDAVKLTNWQTFYKNLILLLLAVVVWFGSYRKKECWDWNPDVPEHDSGHLIEWSLGLLFLLFSLGVGLYSLRHLPLIDFLPFKAGVNLAVQGNKSGTDLVTTLIYKDKTTGQNHRVFAERYDLVRFDALGVRRYALCRTCRTFRRGNRSCAGRILDFQCAGRPYGRTACPAAGVAARDADRSGGTVRVMPRQARGRGRLRPGPGSADDRRYAGCTCRFGIVARCPAYSAVQYRRYDAQVADPRAPGARRDQGGNDPCQMELPGHPDLNGENAEQSILSLVAAHAVQVNISWLLGVCGVVLVLLYVVYFIHRRHV